MPDNAQDFDGEHGRSPIGGSLLVIGSFRGVSMVLSIAGLAVLARLLNPSDYGVVDMIATALAILATGADLGLGIATVQKDRITHAQISTLFWLNSFFGLALWGLCAAIGPLAAWFYGEPALIPVAAVVGIAFFFGGAGAQPKGLLHRRMRFARMGFAEVIGQASGLAVGIVVAFYGGRYWALVASQIVAALMRALLYGVFSGFIPGRPRRGTGVRPMLRFGGFVVGFNIVNYFARNLDNILIGRFLGSASLGLYARAYRLYTLPINISNMLKQPTLPALSRHQEDLRRLGLLWLRVSSLSILLTSSLTLFLCVEADDVVGILLGPKWETVAPVLRILAGLGAVQSIYNMLGLAYASTGRTDMMFLFGVMNTLVLALAFAFGIQYGIEGVAWAYAIAVAFVCTPWGVWVAIKTTRLSILDVANEWFLPATGIIILTMACWGSRTVLSNWGIVGHARLLYVVIVALAGGSALLLAFRTRLRNLMVDLRSTSLNKLQHT